MVLCGGYSGEDVISFKSAETIIANLDLNLYRVFRLAVSKNDWLIEEVGGETGTIDKNNFRITLNNEELTVDAVLNVIHGTPGEDGKIQGYLDMLDIHYNGSGVLTSSLSFNKGFCNQYLKTQGIQVADSVLLAPSSTINETEIVSKLGLPCFVKPNDAGSSLGVTKVLKQEQLKSAIDNAFDVSDRVLIESFIDGVEVTCGVVIKNGKTTPLAVTEIVFENDFFDFEAKYNSAQTQEITPARISDEQTEEIKQTSARIFELLGCKGFFRADYIINNNGLFLIEVNTVPGMSKMSLMPQQIEYAGESIADLLNEQINRLVK